jgi:hypothetical protein
LTVRAIFGIDSNKDCDSTTVRSIGWFSWIYIQKVRGNDWVDAIPEGSSDLQRNRIFGHDVVVRTGLIQGWTAWVLDLDLDLESNIAGAMVEVCKI